MGVATDNIGNIWFSGVGGNNAAVDASGNVWVSNSVAGTLTEVVGFAAPTIQPLATASTAAKIGQMPWPRLHNTPPK